MTGVRREERRLQRVFARALWLVAAAPVAIPLACGSEGGAGGSGSSSVTSSSSSASSSGSGVSDAGADGMMMGDGGGDGSPCDPQQFTPDPPDKCGNYIRLGCGLPANIMPSANCYLLLSDCQSICPGLFFNCHATDTYCVDGGIVTDDAGAVDIDCSICAGGIGRIPAGLERARARRAPSALGDYFAAAAHLEAASVHAFRRLRRELTAHRAPARLLRSARRAERDEVRHTHVTGRIARRFGGAVVRARVEPLATRPLPEVAIENAVEGCVRETFGALLASFQAAHAEDAAIARAMAVIARDETRHAALSWAVGRWASRALDAEARAALVARCQEAIEELRCGVDTNLDAGLSRRAGLPDAAQHRALVDALEAELWKSMRV